MKRIDRIISEKTNFSRKEIKNLIQQGLVTVNDKPVNKSDDKFDENTITVKVNGELLDIREHVYLLLNKPKGYVSTTEQSGQKTVLDLVPVQFKGRALFPAGRLDKDTTGLMLITDDGELAHNILSPNKHIQKEYEVTIDLPITIEMINNFKSGILLNDGECKSADLLPINEHTANVILSEGRYHQIKRMFGCFGAKVTMLHRKRMGNLILPTDLKTGEIREATDLEIIQIQGKPE